MPGPHGRRGLALLLALTAALAVGTTTHAADRAHAKRLTVLGLGQALRRSTRGCSPRDAPARRPAWRLGGAYSVRSGVHVTVYSSRYYAVDNAVNQAAANFVDSLVHGSEIGTVKIYFAPPDEVKILLLRRRRRLLLLVDERDDHDRRGHAWSTVEEVLAHEYGHVANTATTIRGRRSHTARSGGRPTRELPEGGRRSDVPRRRGRALSPEPGRGFAESFCTSTR